MASTAQLSSHLVQIISFQLAPVCLIGNSINSKSPIPPSTNSVLQGFVLGPLLFSFTSHPLQKSLLRMASLNSNTAMTCKYMLLSLNQTYHSMSKNVNNVSTVFTLGSVLVALPLTLTSPMPYLRHLAVITHSSFSDQYRCCWL